MKHYPSIQALRGIAAMAIVLVHSTEIGARYGAARFLTVEFGDVGRAGVDLFFVISGFIIGLVSRFFTNSPASPSAFLRKRVIRLVPLYWIYTTAALGLYFAMPTAFKSLRFEALHTLGSYLFVPIHRADGAPYPVLLVGWTLNMEMLFYLLLGIALILPSMLRIVAMLAALGLFAVVWDPILIEFAYGLFIAWFAQRGLKLMAPLSWMLLIAGFILAPLLHGTGSRAIVWGLPAAMIVLAAVSLDFHVPRFLHALGDASYSIYLSHLFTVNLVHRLLRYYLDVEAATVIAFVACAIVGLIAYRVIEKPLLASLSRSRRISAPSAAS